MRPWLCVMLGVLLCSKFVEPYTGLRHIIDMVTGSSSSPPVGEDEIAADPVEADTKSEDVEEIAEDGDDGDDDENDEGEEDYVDRKKKPPFHHHHHHHHHEEEQHQHHPVPLPPPVSLPPPPPLFPPKETVTATKTVYAEVTKRVTRNPVCMTVCGVKPPCLPAELHHPHHPHDCGHKHGSEDGSERSHDEVTKSLHVEPTSVIRTLPTAAPNLHQENDSSTSNEKALELESSREGHYIEFRKNTPSLSETITEANNDTERLRHIQLHAPVTHTTTSTLWVTTVQEVLDRRITATLEVKNCVPADLNIPICHPPPHKPSIIHKPHRPTTTPPPIFVALSHKPPATHKPPHVIHKPTSKPPLFPIIKPPHYEIHHKPSLTEFGKDGETASQIEIHEDGVSATDDRNSKEDAHEST